MFIYEAQVGLNHIRLASDDALVVIAHLSHSGFYIATFQAARPDLYSYEALRTLRSSLWRVANFSYSISDCYIAAITSLDTF